LRDIEAKRTLGRDYASLTDSEKASVDARIKTILRRNTYDAVTGAIIVSPERAQAIDAVAHHYDGVFGNDAATAKLREQYAMTADTLPNSADRKALGAFFFWTAWSAATDRPDVPGPSYTSNWPHEPLVGNTLTTASAMWSIASVILLIAGIAGMIWYHGSHTEAADPVAPKADPLFNARPTPSMRATRKYFFVVIGL